MDRRELLDKAARDAEERMLLSRVWDKWEQCRLRNVPAATDFLSPQEQASAQRLLHMLGVQDGYVFFGGYGGAERQRLFFLLDWAEEPEPDASCPAVQRGAGHRVLPAAGQRAGGGILHQPRQGGGGRGKGCGAGELDRLPEAG